MNASIDRFGRRRTSRHLLCGEMRPGCMIQFAFRAWRTVSARDANGHRAPAWAPYVVALLLNGRGACLGHEEVDVDLRHALERSADR